MSGKNRSELVMGLKRVKIDFLVAI